MKEIWIGSPKWMQFHLIFFKNADWLIYLASALLVKANTVKVLKLYLDSFGGG